jgi:hypothetical protein
MSEPNRVGAAPDRLRNAENVLRRLGYLRVTPARRIRDPEASFWVEERGRGRRSVPVFVPPADPVGLTERIDRWIDGVRASGEVRRRAIFVAPNDATAEEAWTQIGRREEGIFDPEVSILVVPPAERSDGGAHFHLRRVEPRELLRLSTGVVLGLFRRAQALEGSAQIDFEEMLALLRGRFGVDVHRSLGVTSDEDALFLIYQLALRDAYAPSDAGANLHVLVLKPTGQAARLPWFAG